jgi:ribulose-5-phosphate 4-epimerase/fuculose-1-phosphate aldolase
LDNFVELDTETKIRRDLAAAYRLVALYGWDDLIFTHISARVPGPEHHFLINPYGMMFEEITASSLVKIGMDGLPVGETKWMVNPAGFTIHSAVHEMREDAGCVIHLHTPDGTAVATSRAGLQPLNQTAQLVLADLAYHDYEGVALDHAERPRLQQDLGTKNMMLLRNHGTLAVGRSVAEAFMRIYFLERACTMQVRTRILGEDDCKTRPEVIALNADLGSSPAMCALADHLVWPALLRKLRPGSFEIWLSTRELREP